MIAARHFASRTARRLRNAVTRFDSPQGLRLHAASALATPLKDGFRTFRKFGLLDELVYSLESQSIHAPTGIQNLALPGLLKGHSAFMAAQTGTGKTLAYTLPLLHRLKSEEIASSSRLTEPRRPRALVLQPNRELVQQTESVLKNFIYQVPLRVGCAHSGSSYKQERADLEAGLDILVTSLQRLAALRRKQLVTFGALDTLIIDELDTFLDGGKGDELYDIISQVLGLNYLKDPAGLSESKHEKLKKLQARQVVLVSATMSKRIEELVAHFWPRPPHTPFQNTFLNLIEEKTHYNLSHVKHEFIHVTDMDKFKPLGLVMREFQQHARSRTTSAIVFCNSINSARATEHFLASQGFQAASLHGGIPSHRRVEQFHKFQSRKARVLVATDLAARGLDFPFVSHVVNADFPKSASDYLHRAGRAGRAGREGFIMSLYRNRDMGLIKGMKEAQENNLPLKIRGSAFALKNKEEIMRERALQRREKVSMPKEWRENRNIKQLKHKELEAKRKAERMEKLNKRRNSQGRLLKTEGVERVGGFRLPKREDVRVPRLDKKKEKKRDNLEAKWLAKGRMRVLEKSARRPPR